MGRAAHGTAMKVPRHIARNPAPNGPIPYLLRPSTHVVLKIM